MRKANIGERKNDKRGEQDIFSSQFVGEGARGIRNECGGKVEQSIHQDRRLQGGANILCPQNQK